MSIVGRNGHNGSATAVVPQVQLDPRSRIFVLGAVMMGLFLSSLDQTVVGTALPKIVTDLNGNSLYTWVVTAYLLSSTITVPIYGKFSDVFGRKVMLLIGIVLFLAGSALSGLSQNMTELILFRALQGLGAGALFPISLAIIGDMFTPRERGKYQGLFGGVFAISFIIGPFIGGWITDNISWHWVFYVNIPVGIMALLVIAAILPNFHPPVPTSWRDLDYLGIAVFTAGIIPLLLGLTNKVNSSFQSLPWTDFSVGGLMVIGAILILAFLFIESRAKEPIIPLGLFKNRTYSASNVAMFLLMFGMFSSIIFLPRFYQAVRGYSATDSGYTIWPLLLGLLGASIVSGVVISKIGRYKGILLGSMVLVGLSAYLFTHLTTGTGNTYIWVWMLLMGIGFGPAMSGFTTVIQNVVTARELGVATSTMTFLRQIGGSVGLAISGTIFAQQFQGSFAKHAAPMLTTNPALAHAVRVLGAGALTGVNVTAALARVMGLATHGPTVNCGTATGSLRSVCTFVGASHNAFTTGIDQVFWLSFAAGVTALVATAFVKAIPLRGQATPQTELASALPATSVEPAPEAAIAQ